MKELFNQSFKQALKDRKVLVDDLQQAVTQDGERMVSHGRKPRPTRVVREWTGLSNQVITEGMFNETRDLIQPEVEKSIAEMLKPWIKTGTDKNLPILQVKEIVRSSPGLSTTKVVDALTRYPIAIAVNGSTLRTEIEVPVFPKLTEPRLTLDDARKYGVSPKRVAQAARYQSRPPGGGPAQKAGIQEKRIDPLIRDRALDAAKVRFVEGDEQKTETKTKEIKTFSETSLQEVLYFFTNITYDQTSLVEKRTSVVGAEKILARIKKSIEINSPLMLFVPWGVRPDGTPRLEPVVMDRIRDIAQNLRNKGINAQVLIMPADVYAKEVNNQVDPERTDAYFDYVKSIAEKRGFQVKCWSEIRAENLDFYKKRVQELSKNAILQLLGEDKIRRAIAAATRRSGYFDQTDIENAAFAYLRERITEAELIEEKYQPVKVSAVARIRDEKVDRNLARVYLVPDEEQFCWLK